MTTDTPEQQKASAAGRELNAWKLRRAGSRTIVSIPDEPKVQTTHPSAPTTRGVAVNTPRTPRPLPPTARGDAGYAACLFDQYGTIECREYREHDGRVYLRIVVTGLPLEDLKWLTSTFGGRAEGSRTWEAVAGRAAQLLYQWYPLLHSPERRAQVTAALSLYKRGSKVPQRQQQQQQQQQQQEA